MIDLVNRINGYIRHSSRLVQLNRVCTVLGFKLLSPDVLHNQHGWFAGFFDADGTIGYYLKGPYLQPQLTLSVTNKLYVDVAHFITYFGGAIYLCPPQSIKRNRLFLIKKYYRLLELKAHKAPEGTVLHKAWFEFNRK